MKEIVTIIQECKTVGEIDIAVMFIDTLCSDNKIKFGLLSMCHELRNKIS